MAETESIRRSPREQHGMKHTPEYSVWQGMLNRCRNKHRIAHSNYGARGITVCVEWQFFTKFYRDMGPRPSSKHTLERIDNALGYLKDNCIWATRVAQNRNKRTNRVIVWQGEARCVAEWAEVLGINYKTLVWRLRYGWSVERAFTTPVKHRATSPPRPE